MTPIKGKNYYGEGNERLFVVDTTSRRVRVMHPVTCQERWMTLKDFREWADKSDRRTYVGTDGETRTKVGQGMVYDFEGDERVEIGEHVEYIVGSDRVNVISVPVADWAAWRETAE